MCAVCTACRRAAWTAIVLFCGCASGPYQAGSGWAVRSQPSVASDVPAASREPIELVHGRPSRFVDGVGWVFGIPGKLIYWDRRFENHDVSEETEAAIVDYAAYNNLEDVTIRVNQYAPWEEWKRLRTNTHVGAGWRYTVGVLSLAGYTIFPGRVFGGDRYNPYTNSLYVFSDLAPLGIHGAAYAKDVHGREHPGTYAAVNELSIVSLWHNTIAADDTLNYLAQCEDQAAYEEGVAFLHPYYGSQLGGAAESVVGAAPLLSIAGAVAGHINGRREIRELEQPHHVAADWLELAAPEGASSSDIQRVSFVP